MRAVSLLQASRCVSYVLSGAMLCLRYLISDALGLIRDLFEEEFAKCVKEVCNSCAKFDMVLILSDVSVCEVRGDIRTG